ncbi:MAG TPA: heme ABC exporter ATP-binding protein CcmA [Stellaceae bacterium]|nr:heme ABC exporter ATP-binding protein CcmA [Stellaceae bacterium]
MLEPSPPASAKNGFTGSALACRRGERLVFEGLAFSVPPGGVLVLTGANGSGKSSLLRVMTGLTPAEAGRLAWDGLAISDDPAAHRARLHFIGHAEALKPVLTAAENLVFWAGMRGGTDGAAALDRFRLGALAATPCRLLSAGQRRRLALARLVASHAPLWLLDEPLTGLDDDSVADLHEVIAAHRDAGGRIVLSTHAPLALDGAVTLALGDFAPRWPFAVPP